MTSYEVKDFENGVSAAFLGQHSDLGPSYSDIRKLRTTVFKRAADKNLRIWVDERRNLYFGGLIPPARKPRIPRYKVGYVLVNDRWEYPAEFFRVTKLLDEKNLELEKLNSKVRESTVVSGTATAGAKEKNTPPLRGRINRCGVVRIVRYGVSNYAEKWNGKPVHYQETCHY